MTRLKRSFRLLTLNIQAWKLNEMVISDYRYSSLIRADRCDRLSCREFTEPEQNTFTFSGGEETITLAKATDKKVRCHNLVWTAELPTWVSGGSWTNETLLAVMQTHITKEIEAYGDGCYSWDVVNEALSG